MRRANIVSVEMYVHNLILDIMDKEYKSGKYHPIVQKIIRTEEKLTFLKELLCEQIERIYTMKERG